MEGYIRKELDVKYIGGTIKFLEFGEEVSIYAIDTTNLDLSVWISNMKLPTTSPTIVYFYVDVFDIHTVSSYTIPLFRGVTNSAINGFTIPRRSFYLGGVKDVYNINIVAFNAETPDNHEFFFWQGSEINQYISLLS